MKEEKCNKTKIQRTTLFYELYHSERKTDTKQRQILDTVNAYVKYRMKTNLKIEKYISLDIAI